MKRIQLTTEQENDLAVIMQETGMSRKSAIRKLQRRAKLQAKTTKPVTPKPEPEAKLPAKNASLVAKGAAYHVLAGRPVKQAVVNVFGKSGYALSWVTRAQRMGITPQELCEQFRTNPAKVADQWAELENKKEKSAAKGAA